MAKVRDAADPRRCQAADYRGQCWNRAEPESDFCRLHMGRAATPHEDQRAYLLTQAPDRERYWQLTEPEAIKSLRDEIALAHVLIEKHFNLIRNDADLLARTSTLNTLLLTMERLVKSAHLIECKLDALLSKETVLRLANNYVQIIVRELEGIEGYEAIVDRIKEQMLKALFTATNREPVTPTIEAKLIAGPDLKDTNEFDDFAEGENGNGE